MLKEYPVHKTQRYDSSWYLSSTIKHHSKHKYYIELHLKLVEGNLLSHGVPAKLESVNLALFILLSSILAVIIAYIQST